jgi:hypothetical protein
VVLRETGTGAERLLPHRRAEALAERRQGCPGGRVVRARTDHQDRVGGLIDPGGQLRHGGAVYPFCADQATRAERLVGRWSRSEPVVPGHHDECGAACSRRLVPGAGDCAGHALRPRRLIEKDGVLTGQAPQAPGEERLQRQMATVLLADQHDERRPVHPSGGKRPDGVPQPRGRMKHGQRGLAAPDCPPGRQPHDRALVQREYEAEVLRQSCEQRNLGEPWIAKDRGQAAVAEDVKGRVTDRSRSLGVPHAGLGARLSYRPSRHPQHRSRSTRPHSASPR